MPPAAAICERAAPSAMNEITNTNKGSKTTTIALRVSQYTRELIDSAADAVGKSRTEFMLESARQHAIDVLLDQRVFSLSAEENEAFMHVLDNPPMPNEALKSLFRSKAPWET